MELSIGIFAGDGNILDRNAFFIHQQLLGNLGAPASIGRLAFDFAFNIGMVSSPDVAENSLKFLFQAGCFFAAGVALFLQKKP